MSGMSQAALGRCRTLRVTHGDPGDGAARGLINVRLEVFDPRLSKAVASTVAKTPQDAQRITRAWVSKYRIPAENIKEESAEPTG